MKTAIIYYSEHHGNTRKVLEGIAAEHEVTLVDIMKEKAIDLSGFDRIGIASGIYYSSFAKQLLKYAQENLPEGKEVFFLGTCGSQRKGYFDAIKKITDAKNCKTLGEFTCLGFDTFGPFKLVGGIAKGHPTDEEIAQAVAFYAGLEK